MAVDLIKVFEEIKRFDVDPPDAIAALFDVEREEYDRLMTYALPRLLSGFLGAMADSGEREDELSTAVLASWMFTMGLTVGGAAAREAVAGVRG